MQSVTLGANGLSCVGATAVCRKRLEVAQKRTPTFYGLVLPCVQFLHLLSVDSDTEIVAAQMRNDAGIVGAAVGGFNLIQRDSKVRPSTGDAQTHAYLHHEKVFAFHQAAKDAAEALGALGVAAVEVRPVAEEQGASGNGRVTVEK